MALGVTAYSEAPFSADNANVVAYPSGIELTAQENSGIVNIDVDVSVTGTTLAMTTGQALGGSKVTVPLSGNALSGALGTTTEVPVGQQVDVTGFDLTANASNPTHDTLTAFGEAPFATLSPATFNIPVDVEATTGGIAGTFPLPMSLGNVTEITADANVPVTGQSLTFNLDSVTAFADVGVDVTGQTLTSTLGTTTALANTFAAVSGEAMTAEEGTVDPSPDATVTGIGMSAALGLGTVTAGADIDVTGQEMTMNQGTVLAFTDVVTEDVTGIGFNINLGSVVGFADVDVSVTGFDLTMQENAPTVTGDANVTATALPMTAALGTAELDANTLVDLTGQAMTMQEGTATAPDSLAILTGIEMTMAEGSIAGPVIWNPVPTGNAPINPPGWKEVA